MMKIAIVAIFALLPTVTLAEEACVDLAMCQSHIGKLEKRISSLESQLKILNEDFANFKKGFDLIKENDLHRQGTVGMTEEVKSQAQNFGGVQCPEGEYLAGINFWGRNVRNFNGPEGLHPSVTGFSGADFYCRRLK